MSEPEVTTVVGSTGGGKSALLMALLKFCCWHIVMTTKPDDYHDGFIQVYSWQELRDLLLSKYHLKKLKVCLRLVVGPRDNQLPVDTMNGVADTLFAIQKHVFNTRGGKSALRRIGLIVDEAQVFCPHNNVRGAEWIVGQGRSWNICPTFATQRPTNIPPVIRDNSKNWYVLMLSGDTAIKTVKSIIPDLKVPKQFTYKLYRELKLVDQGSTKSPKKILNLP